MRRRRKVTRFSLGTTLALPTISNAEYLLVVAIRSLCTTDPLDLFRSRALGVDGDIRTNYDWMAKLDTHTLRRLDIDIDGLLRRGDSHRRRLLANKPRQTRPPSGIIHRWTQSTGKRFATA